MHDIAYITDDNYVLPTKVSISSIVRNVTDADISVHVVAVGLSEPNRRMLASLGSANVRVDVIDGETPYVGMVHHPYISRAVFVKFRLVSLFRNLDKLLYIDGDTIVTSGILEIFKTDVSRHYAAVVRDATRLFRPQLTTVNVDNYFNAGVLFLNLAKMRADNIEQSLNAEAERINAGDDPFVDQTVFNAVLGADVVMLGPKYNLLSNLEPTFVLSRLPDVEPVQVLARFFRISDEEMADALDNPAIIHLTGGKKAWNAADARCADEWLDYLPKEEQVEILKRYCVELSKSLDATHRQIDSLNTSWAKQTELFRKQNAELRKIVNEIRGIAPIGIYIELRKKVWRMFGKRD